MAAPAKPQQDILRFRGCAQFRQRVIFATLAHKRLRIDGIRDKDEAPGLRDFEANFLRLVEKLTNGCRIEINETGTTLKYAPGWIVGGSVEHDCGIGRSIGWFLEGILPMIPFGKKPLHAILSGITNDDADLSIDIIRTVHLPIMTHFGMSEGLKLDIQSRGCPQAGGGRVALQCPVVRELKPISLTEEGFVKRIRGISYSCKVSPQMANRIVEAARGVLNPLLADVYIYTDHRKGTEGGSSPGYGVSLVASSTSGCIYGAQRCSGIAKGLTDPLGAGNGVAAPPLPPEELGRAAAQALLDQIAAGGCIDDTVQPLVFALMLLGPEDVSRVRIGRLSTAGIATLRLIKDVWGVSFRLKTEQQAAPPEEPPAKRRKRADEDDVAGAGEEDEDLEDAGVERKNRKAAEKRQEEEVVQQLALTAAATGGYSASSTVLVSCLGIGFKNFSKKVT